MGMGPVGRCASPPGRCSQVSANQGAQLLLSVVAVHCDPCMTIISNPFFDSLTLAGLESP